MRFISMFVILAALFCMATSLAAQERLQFYLAGSVGYNSYVLTDVNNEIKAFNAVSGLDLNEINGGPAFQLEGGLVLVSGIQFGLGYERLTGSSKISDPSGSLEYKMPANIYFIAIDYGLPSSRPFTFAIGGAVGMINTAGGIDLMIVGEGSGSAKTKGSGLYAEGRLSGNYSFSPSVKLVPAVGYRFAKISETKINGQILYNPSGEKYALDHSGISLHLGLKFLFGL